MKRFSSIIFQLALFVFVLLSCPRILFAQDKPTSVPMQSINVARNETTKGNSVLVQGIVTDAQGETLPGAHVLVQETKAVAVTDANGTFLVSIPRNQSVAESQARQQPVTAFRPTSSGAQAYFSLAREVLDNDR